jgi:preprotein translocase subunit SecE
MAKYNPFEFVQEVRHEVAKVTWPTWKEVWITTLMAIFFLFADQVLGWFVSLILDVGR